MGIMENKMETTILGLYIPVYTPWGMRTGKKQPLTFPAAEAPNLLPNPELFHRGS